MGKCTDHTGKKYGYLTALRFFRTDRRTYSGGQKTGGVTLWVVRCVCGKEYEMAIKRAVIGRSKSCGCMRAKLIGDAKRLPENQEIFNRLFYKHKYSAKLRGYDSYLTKNEHTSIIQRPCHYCGSFSKRACRTKTKNHQQVLDLNSVDRINNEPYYSKKNAVSACITCQMMKNKHTKNFFINHAKKVANHNAHGGDR